MTTPKIESWIEAAADEIYSMVARTVDVMPSKIVEIISKYAPAHPAAVVELVAAVHGIKPLLVVAFPLGAKQIVALDEAVARIESTPPDSLSAELVSEMAEALRACRFAINPLLTELSAGNEDLRSKVLAIQDKARTVLRKYDEAK